MSHAVAVLWVDADASIHQVYETLLDAIGVETFRLAASGEQALAETAARAFDLILLDDAAPDCGRDLARQIRAQPSLSAQARISLVSGAEDASRAPADIAAFIDGYLARPVTARALRDEVLAARRLSPRG